MSLEVAHYLGLNYVVGCLFDLLGLTELLLKCWVCLIVVSRLSSSAVAYKLVQVEYFPADGATFHQYPVMGEADVFESIGRVPFLFTVTYPSQQYRCLLAGLLQRCHQFAVS